MALLFQARPQNTSKVFLLFLTLEVFAALGPLNASSYRALTQPDWMP